MDLTREKLEKLQENCVKKDEFGAHVFDNKKDFGNSREFMIEAGQNMVKLGEVLKNLIKDFEDDKKIRKENTKDIVKLKLWKAGLAGGFVVIVAFIPFIGDYINEKFENETEKRISIEDRVKIVESQIFLETNK